MNRAAEPSQIPRVPMATGSADDNAHRHTMLPGGTYSHALMQIAQLAPATSYALRVRATVRMRFPSSAGKHSPEGCSLQRHPLIPSPPPSELAFCTTQPAVPGRPHPPAMLSHTSFSLTVRWMPPVDSGGVPVYTHRLAFRGHDADRDKVGWTIIYEGPAVEVQVPNLLPAHKYDFRLQVCELMTTRHVAKCVVDICFHHLG